MTFNKIVRGLKKLLGVILGKYYTYSIDKYNHHRVAFSQEGEDLILARFFEGQTKGFYVDIGAHHPQRFSNTYFFYLRSWRGINIDAMPNSMSFFNHVRQGDTNIEAAISDSSDILTYYIFDEPALNGFVEEISINYESNSNFRIVDRKEIKVQRLSEILDRYLPEGQQIDFMSIDVEGIDHQVLLSNDWSKYKPNVILVEELFILLEDLPQQSKTFTFLREQGYRLFARSLNTSFYKLATV